MTDHFNYHDRKEEDFDLPTEETASLYDDPTYGEEYNDPDYDDYGDEEDW